MTSSEPRNQGADRGLLPLPFRLPFLPVQAVVGLAEAIRDQAERELHDPAAVRRQLEEAQQARVSGEIADHELAQLERDATWRLIQPGHRRRSPMPERRRARKAQA